MQLHADTTLSFCTECPFTIADPTIVNTNALTQLEGYLAFVGATGRNRLLTQHRALQRITSAAAAWPGLDAYTTVFVPPLADTGVTVTVPLPVDKVAALRQYVNDGGVLVVFGDPRQRGLALLQTITGQTIEPYSHAQCVSSAVKAARSVNVADTTFAGATTELRGDVSDARVRSSSLPATARRWYTSSARIGGVSVDTTWVFSLTQQKGAVVFVGSNLDFTNPDVDQQVVLPWLDNARRGSVFRTRDISAHSHRD